MIHEANTVRWPKGSFVLHDADAKKPVMLMRVVGYDGETGECKTRYAAAEHQPSRIWRNDVSCLHDPSRFGVAVPAELIAAAAESISVQIDYAADDSCQIRLWAKGTHPPGAFLVACERALRAWDDTRTESLAGKPVRHDLWRTVRASPKSQARCVVDYVHTSSKPGPGAYAVTILDEWLPLNATEDANA